jgi:hypothetical protein
MAFVKEVVAFQVIESDEPTPESPKFAEMHCASDLYDTGWSISLGASLTG